MPQDLSKVKALPLGAKVHLLAHVLRGSFDAGAGDGVYWQVRNKFFDARHNHPKPGVAFGSDWQDFVTYKASDPRFKLKGRTAVLQGSVLDLGEALGASGLDEVFEEYCPIEVQLQIIMDT